MNDARENDRPRTSLLDLPHRVFLVECAGLFVQGLLIIGIAWLASCLPVPDGFTWAVLYLYFGAIYALTYIPRDLIMAFVYILEPGFRDRYNPGEDRISWPKAAAEVVTMHLGATIDVIRGHWPQVLVQFVVTTVGGPLSAGIETYMADTAYRDYVLWHYTTGPGRPTTATCGA
jgi:hypothetical protein